MYASISRFLLRNYTLFSVFKEDEGYAIFDRAYNSEEKMDNATLCELCAMATTGCQYDSDSAQASLTEALYRTACATLDYCIEAEPLRGMRILACLSISAFMAKRESARTTIGISHNQFSLRSS